MAAAAQRPVLVFDLDDTLWDVQETLRAAHAAVIAEFPALPEECRTTRGMKDRMLQVTEQHPDRAHDFSFLRLAVLAEALGSQEQGDAAFAVWFARRNKPIFFSCAIDTLKALRAEGYRLGVITDGNANPMDIPELDGLFDWWVSAVEAGAPKPDARPFELASRKAGVPCSEMVYIGDNYRKDVLGAKQAGMRTVWVRTDTLLPRDPDVGIGIGEAFVPEVSEADAEVPTIAGLHGVLGRLQA
eukprot:TRINITY_DN606_c0_g1_i2.p1 TRINITY_DN606_c0_g1~~TRINITY_DN606_c0_g1_i2.p1  ORF type:complete len:268 (+),score=90.65 TRINITY_DN606_c0_g1_i2:76-804(+)